MLCFLCSLSPNQRCILHWASAAQALPSAAMVPKPACAVPGATAQLPFPLSLLTQPFLQMAQVAVPAAVAAVEAAEEAAVCAVADPLPITRVARLYCPAITTANWTQKPVDASVEKVWFSIPHDERYDRAVWHFSGPFLTSSTKHPGDDNNVPIPVMPNTTVMPSITSMRTYVKSSSGSEFSTTFGTNSPSTDGGMKLTHSNRHKRLWIEPGWQLASGTAAVGDWLAFLTVSFFKK
jgi:hypothetical protein